jgi:carboxyl-terminal processing protease
MAMFREWCLRAAALAVFVAFLHGGASAEPRVALVIGNSAYKGDLPALTNPSNDAKLMAKTLKGIGFDVIETEDADQVGMKKAIGEFGDKLAAAGGTATGLFFYAGHGLQVAGENYLIPIDAEIEKEADVDLTAVSAETVMKQMEFAGAAVNIIILDACRNNPLSNGSRGMTRGLARIDSAPKGSFIAYSTAPGSVAQDGDGADSPYTTALAQTLTKPGMSIGDVFQEVRTKVLAATGQQQTTWDSNSLTGQYYFTPPVAQTAGVDGGPSNASGANNGSVVGTATDSGAVDVEMTYWNSIKDSNDPAVFEAYVAKYPNGNYVDLADIRLRKLKSGSQVASADTGNTASGNTSTAERSTVPDNNQQSLQSLEQQKNNDSSPDMVFVALDQTVYAKSGGQVRTEPDSRTALLVKLPNNAEVHATGKSADGRWWRVSTPDGQTGYMHKSVVSEQPIQVSSAQTYQTQSSNVQANTGETPADVVMMAPSGNAAAQPQSSGNGMAGVGQALGQVGAQQGGFGGALAQVIGAVAANSGQQQAAQPQMNFAPVNQTVQVRGGAVIRATPLYSAQPIAQVRADGQLQAMGRSSDGLWWQVALPNGSMGYLEGNAIKR